jgi:hypothetical protein
MEAVLNSSKNPAPQSRSLLLTMTIIFRFVYFETEQVLFLGYSRKLLTQKVGLENYLPKSLRMSLTLLVT